MPNRALLAFLVNNQHLNMNFIRNSLILCASFLGALTAQAVQTTTLNTATVTLNLDGSSSTFNLKGTANTAFSNATLGTFNLLTDTFTLNAATATFSGSQPGSSTLYYTVYDASNSQIFNGSQTMSNNSGTYSFSGASINLLTNITTPATPQAYHLVLNAGSGSAVTGNLTAYFTVVPEPSTYAAFAGLAVLGGAALIRRRRK
jgi:hypothetical protein